MPSRTITSIILGAGKGTRMHNPETPKVCNVAGGRVVIHRTLETLERCGVHDHVMVVGYRADQVREVVDQAPSTVDYVFQAEQKGTGHATRLATDVLEARHYTGDLLILAGDKVLEDAIFRRLLDTFYADDCDLAVIVGDPQDFPSSGHIITDPEGRILGNVEIFDIKRMQLLIDLRARLADGPLSAAEAVTVVRGYFPEKKAKLALDDIWDALLAGTPLTQATLDARFTENDYLLPVLGKFYPPEYLDRVEYVNLCIFLFKGPVLYRALNGLNANNAQNEEYLTDLIGSLPAAGYKVKLVPIRYAEECMAFNTREELEVIETYYAAKAAIPLRSTSAWEARLAGVEGAALLEAIYGDRPAVIAQKRAMLAEMLAAYRERYGDDEVCISRAPARVNIMGRHVDHQGGMNNHIVIDRDTWVVVGRRRDRTVSLANLSDQFPAREVTLEEIMTDYTGQPWLDFVNSPDVLARAAAMRGDWSQYVAAPLARLQAAFPETPLGGLNLLCAGNVPIGGGLSSSSSIVVAVMEAAVALHGLALEPERFVELCGEGEWFVGTRGGAGDQAAMKFARRGAVVQVGFFPFRTVTTVPFPAGYAMLVCNSLLRAKKTEGARDTFNHRVACYGIGREIFKQAFPQYADRIGHLRDIDPETLGVSYPDFLRMLTCIPLSLTRAEIAARLDPAFCAQVFGTHADLGDYPVRAVVLFGLAEIARSRRTPEVLAAGQVDEFGGWMTRSHDGDRVARWTGETSEPFTVDCSDAALLALAERAAAGDPAAALHAQAGAYACSVPDIDRMVDLALAVDGVAGVQLAGAGLGGCIMVLAREDAVPCVVDALAAGYYRPRGLEPEIYTCYPTAGSGVVGTVAACAMV
jgi:N-acetylgalactosamine kinase